MGTFTPLQSQPTQGKGPEAAVRVLQASLSTLHAHHVGKERENAAGAKELHVVVLLQLH